MPLDNEKTFAKFGYHISDLKPMSNKNIYFICDNCEISKTRPMCNYSHTLKNQMIKGTYCLACSRAYLNKNTGQNKKYRCNEDYFSVPNLKNSYWAGFIAADGCILDKADGQNSLKIALSVKDEDKLIEFKNDIQYNGIISKRLPCSNGFINGRQIHNNGLIELKIRSQQICNDLGTIFNIHPRKSLTHEPPIDLTFEQELAFIIGYIDGDGWISVLQNKNIKHPIIFGILGTSNFLTWTNQKIHQLSMFDSKMNVNKTKDNVYRLTGTGRFAYDVLKYLETILVPKFERKWSNVRNFSSTTNITPYN